MDTEREILEQNIKDHRQAIDKAKTDLKALDKPELRHGDYGYSGRDGVKHLDPRTFSHGHSWGVTGLGNCDDSPLRIVLGNTFKDLARNAEDLEEFKISGRSVSLDSDGAISIRLGSNWILFNESKEEFHQKFGQMLATARRKQK